MALKVAVQQSKYKTQFKQQKTAEFAAEQKHRYYRSNAGLNRYVLRSVLKAETESIFLMSGGREFQRRGAERLKALDPMVDRRAGGTVRLMEEADLRDRVGILMHRRAERYVGARLWMA